MTKEVLLQLIEDKLGCSGRMISGSKSFYRKQNPDSVVFFNACIFDGNAEQIWWGDIDITKDKNTLDEIAKAFQDIFYVTPEHAFRTDFNDVTMTMLESEHVLKFNLTSKEKSSS